MRWLIFLFIFIVSCSPQRRLNRLIRKHPELIRIDSIRVIDTFISKEVSVDTFKLMNKYDTFILNKERLTVQVIRHQDSIYVFGKCDNDTIVLERKIPIKTIQVNQQVPIWNYIVMGILALLFFIFLLRK